MSTPLLTETAGQPTERFNSTEVDILTKEWVMLLAGLDVIAWEQSDHPEGWIGSRQRTRAQLLRKRFQSDNFSSAVIEQLDEHFNRKLRISQSVSSYVDTMWKSKASRIAGVGLVLC